jgi:hypothetical protein
MYQQLLGYKVEEKYLGVREQKRLNTTALDQWYSTFFVDANYTYCIIYI